MKQDSTPASPEADAIRSNIDATRQRMDETVDALGERLKPRHLLDEAIGLFRRSTEGDGQLNEMREKITHSAASAMHSVVDTVKKNPVPALLIGAGVAWMIYNSRKSSGGDLDYADQRTQEALGYDPDIHYDRPLDYPPSGISPAEPGWSDQGGSMVGEGRRSLRERAQQVGGQAREKLQHVRDQAGEKLHALRDRASDLGHRVGERSREMYSQTRDKVATTTREHPLEVGLMCLAAGVIAGLALPTPNVVNRRVGDAADHLRDRTREAGSELLEKGKRVARAAATAAKEEAQAQGLSGSHGRNQPDGNQSGSETNDPTMARPTM